MVHCNVVSRLTLKIFHIESPRFTGILVSMGSCALEVSHSDSSSNVGVMAPDRNIDQHVSHDDMLVLL